MILLLFYLAFAMFYSITLAMNAGAWKYFSWRIIYMDYPLKAIFTIPIWYLIFDLMKRQSLYLRIGITILLMPIWVKGWQATYYFIVDNFTDSFRLQGTGEWWDVYIPGLFYFIQFGMFFAVEYYQNFIKTLREKAESEKLVLAGELSALKAQLNPHFLYNAFNTISASVPPREESTRELIAHLSDMFRYQLMAGRKDRITLSEEVEFIRDYLTLEKARFADRLRVNIQIPAVLSSTAVPPLILQPLVENAIKHGIAPLIDGGEVSILAKQTDDGNLLLTVADTGGGFKEHENTKGTGLGLQNIRRRLELLFNSELKIKTNADQGTEVSFQIPLTYVTQDRTDRRRSARPQTPQRVPS